MGPLACLSPAAQVIALTAGGAMNDGRVCVRLAGGEVDWGVLRDHAVREWAAAPVARRIAAASGGTCPPDAAEILRVAAVAEFQSRFMSQWLQRTLAIFNANGLDALLLKGAGLAYTVHESPSERPMGDIDVLVRPDRALDAWNLTLEHGWIRRRDLPAERMYLAHQHLPPLEDRDGLGLGLELHVDLFTHQAPFLLRADAVWARARAIQVGRQWAFVPHVHDQLLHVATHFAWAHEMRFGAWRAFRDVSAIVRSATVDWDAFVREARDCRGATSCFWMLRLARDLAGVRIRNAVLDALQPALPRRVIDLLARHFAMQMFPERMPRPSVAVARRLWWLSILPPTQRHGRSRPWLDKQEWTRPAPDAGPGNDGVGRRLARTGEYLGTVLRTPEAKRHARR